MRRNTDYNSMFSHVPANTPGTWLVHPGFYRNQWEYYHHFSRHVSYIVGYFSVYFVAGVLECTVHKTKQENVLCPMKP